MIDKNIFIKCLVCNIGYSTPTNTCSFKRCPNHQKGSEFVKRAMK